MSAPLRTCTRCQTRDAGADVQPVIEPKGWQLCAGCRLAYGKQVLPPPTLSLFDNQQRYELPIVATCGACKQQLEDGLCACGMFARWPRGDATSDTP